MTAPALLATIDVEIAHDRDLNEQAHAIWRLGWAMTAFPATWFCTADAAERFSEPLLALVRMGHTMGCHGRDHGAWEDYRRLSPTLVFETLSNATDRIESALGVRPRVFRGPRMTTSATTHNALRELGYTADYSVCTHRFDFMTASRFDWHWLRIGPAPYSPAVHDPFSSVGLPTEGELFVVPLSGFGVPLVSGTVYLLAERFMFHLAKFMARNASRAGAPIVYLFHSYEFVEVKGPIDYRPAHQRLYPAFAEERYMMNLRFLSKLRYELGLEPITAEDYRGVITQHAG